MADITPERIAEIRARHIKAGLGRAVMDDWEMAALCDLLSALDAATARADLCQAETRAVIMRAEAAERRVAELTEWRDMSTAPKDRAARIDLLIENTLDGNRWRVADAAWTPWDGHDAWAVDGKWITGRSYIDDDGDRCFQPCNHQVATVRAIGWLPLPPCDKP